MFKDWSYSIGPVEIVVGLVVLVILAFLVWLIIRIILKAAKQRNSDKPTDSLEIAKQRYAKGEISKEQFEQIKKDLS